MSTSQPMDVFNTRYFRVNRLMLSLFGLWPTQSSSKKNVPYCCGILGILIILLPQIGYLFKRMRSVNDFYAVLPIFIGTILVLLKTVSFHWQSENFRIIVQHVRHDWCLLAKHNDIWILVEYVERSRIFTLAYLIFTTTCTASFMTVPLTIRLFDSILASNVTRSKQMPHPTEFFLDMEKYYYILLTITFVGYIICAILVNATDSIYFALLQHICGTLTILRFRLEKFAAHDKSKCIDPMSKGNRDVENMVQCIQLQVRIERLIHLVESTFAIGLFTDIGIGILILCCSCVMIINRTELVKNGPLVLIQCIRFFYSSWLGQMIIDHSCQISVAAYNGMWYETSMETRKLLLFLLMKCQKPFRITMIKLYIICLENYSALMRTSASYVTLMLSLKPDDT